VTIVGGEKRLSGFKDRNTLVLIVTGGSKTAVLDAVTRNFEARLVRGLEANREHAAAFVEKSLALAAALAPIIGYERTAALAKEVSASGRTIREVAREHSGIPSAELERLLDLRSHT
jgi:fumarate hydratase class II